MTLAHCHNGTYRYWRVGLTIASNWRKRAGLPPKPQWQDVLRRLARPASSMLNGTEIIIYTGNDGTRCNAIGWLNGAAAAAGGLNETIMNATLWHLLFTEHWDTEWCVRTLP